MVCLCVLSYIFYFEPHIWHYMHKFHWHKIIFLTPKHLTTFKIMKKVAYIKRIVVTVRMTIKFQIHVIPTTKASKTTLHYKVVKNKFAMILSWKDLNFLNIKLFKVQIYNFFCGTRFWQGIQREKYLETNPTWRVYGETIKGACFGGSW
jgi:hypothetical protein